MAHRPPPMTPAAIVLCAFVLAAPAYAGTFPVAWTVPLTGDKPDSCGVVSGPLRDPVRTLLRVRDCGTYDTTYTIASMPGDSMWANIVAPSGHVYYAKVTVENAVGVSCRGMEITFTLPDTATIPPPPPPPPPGEGIGILGRYYRGLNRNTFVGSRRDSTISFKWALDAPMVGVPADSFSVEWDGEIFIPTAGDWTLCIESEDGAQVYTLNWNWSINHYEVQPVTEWCKVVTYPTAGWQQLHVNYMARLGNSECTLRYLGPGVSKQIVPRGALR